MPWYSSKLLSFDKICELEPIDIPTIPHDTVIAVVDQIKKQALFGKVASLLLDERFTDKFREFKTASLHSLIDFEDIERIRLEAWSQVDVETIAKQLGYTDSSVIQSLKDEVSALLKDVLRNEIVEVVSYEPERKTKAVKKVTKSDVKDSEQGQSKLSQLLKKLQAMQKDTAENGVAASEVTEKVQKPRKKKKETKEEENKPSQSVYTASFEMR